MTKTTTNSRSQRQPRELAPAKLDSAQLVKWEDRRGNALAISLQEARLQFCATATDAEVLFFLHQAAALRANPYLRDIHLVKYATNAPAAPVVGINYMQSVAREDPLYRGLRTGLVDREGNALKYVVGTEKPDLLGGAWCDVWIHGFAEPVHVEVAVKEFDKGQATWKTMKAHMIEKCAKAKGLRAAGITNVRGLSIPEELPGSTITSEDLPTEPISQPEEEEFQGETVEVTPEEAEQPEQEAAEEEAGPPDPHEDLRVALKAELIRCFTAPGEDTTDWPAARRWVQHSYGTQTEHLRDLEEGQLRDGLRRLEKEQSGALAGWQKAGSHPRPEAEANTAAGDANGQRQIWD